jgi:cytochrome bd-type quinol oxidase subunit 2
VSPQLFCIAFLFGTAGIALWIDARFPALAPADLTRAMARAGIAVAAGWLLFPRMWDAVSSSSVLMALFVIALPCLTYSLLSAIWAIRKLQAALQGFR